MASSADGERVGEDDCELSRNGTATQRLLKRLYLDKFFDKGVQTPKKGEMLKSVSLKVPLCDRFVQEQLRAGAAPRRNNSVCTSKYTIWTFILLAAAYQFRRFVNAFFLIIVTLLVIGNMNPELWLTPWAAFGTASYLALIVVAGMAVEGYDDLGKHRGDAEENEQSIDRVEQRTGKLIQTSWGELLPGDIVVVNDRENFPADLVLLCSSSDKHNNCYIETSGIDGETNLKIKDAPVAISRRILDNKNDSLPRLSQAEKEDAAQAAASQVRGNFEYEQPNAFLQFNGSVTFPRHPANGKSEKAPLEFRHLILRGSQLRNTKWVLGLVVYAGHETKLSLSRKASPVKFSRIDILLNKVMLVLFCVYLCGLCGAANFALFHQPDTRDWWYFKNTSSVDGYVVPGALAFFVTFMILFSNWIPVSMVLLVEIVNTYLAMLINYDCKMYHPETNTAACCRSPTLSAELGQITHFFSDKTGTLTRNEMKLVGLYVDKTYYGIKPPPVGLDGRPIITEASTPDVTQSVKETDDVQKRGSYEQMFSDLQDVLKRDSADAVRCKCLDMLVFLAVCHTVILETDPESKKVTLNSESPDEEAFIKGAAALGVKLLDASDGGVSIQLENGDVLRYQILALNTFNSTRKRMSLVVCRPDKSIVAMMKGADNFVISRLAKGQEDQVEDLQQQLLLYAWAGLRTLVMAQKELSESEYLAWAGKYADASVAPSSERTQALADVAELVECDMKLVGATAIEDQLQVGVPEAVETIRNAGIQVWVLTGDKVETAINIGLSSRLLDSTMIQIKVTSRHRKVVAQQVEDLYEVLFPRAGVSAASIAPLEAADVEDGKSERTSSMTKFHLDLENLQETLQNGGYLALVISGDALELLLSKQKGSTQLEMKLLHIARACKVVLACRVSPAQKALVVEMVRYAPDNKALRRQPVTLAIGDGANDVPMIQSAHVGIGISGHEGRQAVNSSDFSIAQFRFAVRLLLLHGRLNYRRLALLICFVCYSWIVYILVLFMYQPLSLWSGSQVYHVYLYTFFAPPLLNFAILSHGWFATDMSFSAVMAHPQSYRIGAENRDLDLRAVLKVLVLGVLHVALIGFFIFLLADPTEDTATLGSTTFTSVFMVVYFEKLFRGDSYTSVTFLAFGFLFVAFLVGMSLATSPAYLYSANSLPALAWARIGIVVVSTLVVRATVSLVQREFRPTPVQIIQEQERISSVVGTTVGVSTAKVVEESMLLVAQPLPLAIRKLKAIIIGGSGKANNAARGISPLSSDLGVSSVEPADGEMLNFAETVGEQQTRRLSTSSFSTTNLGALPHAAESSGRLSLTPYSLSKALSI